MEKIKNKQMEFMKNISFNTKRSTRTAYFSMEFAFDARIPNYAGGLGVLAADMMYSMADLGTPAVGISLIYHQSEDPNHKFHPEFFMHRLPQTVQVQIEDRSVTVGAYQYNAVSPSGNTIPIFFLTTFSGDNEAWDRDITKNLYASGAYQRLTQEVILGIGGVKMLRALGYKNLKNFHLNEGHAALSTLELQREYNWNDDKVRKVTKFTTHTPVAAGHDKFDYDLAYQVLGDQIPWHIREIATPDQLHLTHLALNLSSKTNGVSLKHADVCHDMFPGHDFIGITNGIHHVRWAAPATRMCYDKFMPKWRRNPSLLTEGVAKIPTPDLVNMRAENKRVLIDWINENPSFFHHDGDLKPKDLFDYETLTIVFARRFVPYKRPLLIFRDLERLQKLGHKKIQLIFAGNCHPDDHFCNNRKLTLRNLAKELRGSIKIAVIPQYNVDIAVKLVSGTNLWLNNPVSPREASGTSGMKAALNGALNLSIADGWWLEGHEMKPDSGWSFGNPHNDLPENERDDRDADELYTCLEEALDEYENNPTKWGHRLRESMSLVGYFNTHRVIEDYQAKMWD